MDRALTRAPIRHALWPTPVPPVATGQWSQIEWERYEAAFRPEGYFGDAHDSAAWTAFEAERQRSFVREYVHREFGIENYGAGPG